VDFAAEGPIKKGYKGSYLANYRYSTLSMLNGIGIKIAGDVTPVFQDASFKLHLPTEKAGIFSVWGIGGLSKSEFEAERDPAKWLEADDRFDDRFKAGMGAAGLSHVYFFKSNAYLETVLSLSQNLSRYQNDSLGLNFDPHPFHRESFNNSAVRASVLYNHKLNARHTVRFGTIYSSLSFDMFNESRNEQQELQTYLDNAGSTHLAQAYGQWKYRLLDNLTLNTGLHLMRLGLNGSTSLEPRAGLRWNLSERQALGFGFGVHSRHESMAVYFARQPLPDGSFSQANKNLDLAKARHYVISYDLMLRPDLRFKAETYYQDLYDVAVSADPKKSFAAFNSQEGLSADSLVSSGTGRNYGLELSLEKFFTNNYYFLVTGSLYDSKYTALEGVERNTRFNGNHILNVLAGKEYKVGRSQNNLIGLNIRTVWAGGNRYTPIDLERSRQEGKAVLVESQRLALKADDYFRADLRVSYRKNKPKASHIVSLDVQNVTNRLNMYRQYYDKEKMVVAKNTQAGLIPFLNYRIEF
jgi:hypothetical protein